jgi:uncharacterized secreted protein with C-terminal beta-propeller domain
MQKTVGVMAAGAALLGIGVVGGWAAGSSHPRTTHVSAPPLTTVHTVTGGNADFHGQLVSFDSCSALLDAIHARARSAVGPYGFSQGYQGYRYAIPQYEKAAGTESAPAPVSNAAGAATPSSPADSQTLSHSTTNTQVTGVDEPDLVKTDGRYMVSIDGQMLHIVDVRTAKLRSTIALPQSGDELLLLGDRVVVLSDESSGSNVVPEAATGVAMPSYGGRYYPSYAATGTTNATIVDISDPDAPTVVHRWSFNGDNIAARVVDGTIRLVLSSNPPQESWAQPRDGTSAEISRATKLNQQIVDATPLSAWVPSWTGDDGQSHPLSACDAVATPSKPSSLSMVTVVSLDPGAASPGAGTSVLGAGNVAYAEGQHLFVSDSGTYPVTAVPTSSTAPGNPTIHLLEFDISDPAQARYLAMGSVPGSLHDSYALSEYQNNLRVTATTTNPSGSTNTGVDVLTRDGDQLHQIGSVSGLGTGEQVYAVRYEGDRGYVVTFQQMDPLHVLDLSNPAKPVLRGTLTLSGYSSLLLPLSGDRLLGIGRAVAPEGGSECVPNEPCRTFVVPAGLQLSLFDVSDAAHPKLLDKHVLPDTYAQAVGDPHAVTLSPDGNLMILPSTSGPLAVGISATKLTTTTGAFTKPYSVQDQRTIIAGDRLFELADRGVAVRTLPDLHQTGWIAF